jgi:hypothetical protein
MAMRIACMLTLAAALLTGSGCELTSLPIIIDGSAVADTLRVDIDPPIPPALLGSVSANLGALLTDLDLADSIRLYDLSIQFVNNTTDPAAALTGMLLMQRSGSAQRDTLVVLNGARIADFSVERSIFSQAVAGYQYNPRGVGALAQLLRGPQPLPFVTFTIQALADKPSLHFTMRLKVYAQVFTSP